MYLKLDLPPSTNKVMKQNKTKECSIKRDYYAHVAKQLQIQLPDYQMISGKVEIICRFHMTSSRDIDNQFKVLLDAFQYNKMIENDSLVVTLIAEKVPATIKQQFCEVWLTPKLEFFNCWK